MPNQNPAKSTPCGHEFQCALREDQQRAVDLAVADDLFPGAKAPPVTVAHDPRPVLDGRSPGEVGIVLIEAK